MNLDLSLLLQFVQLSHWFPMYLGPPGFGSLPLRIVQMWKGIVRNRTMYRFFVRVVKWHQIRKNVGLKNHSLDQIELQVH